MSAHENALLDLIYYKSAFDLEKRAEQWLELTGKAFDFATYARQSFIDGDMETKKSISMALGQNPTLTDGKLFIQGTKWILPIAKAYPPLEAEYRRLELKKLPLNKAQNEAKTRFVQSGSPRWTTLERGCCEMRKRSRQIL